VLQFNRVDFRLPWLRARFPCAKIVHLYRHPRDQWCSVLQDPSRFPKDAAMRDFEAVDEFYLLAWVRDLCFHFPFLDPERAQHHYQLLYFLWRLSWTFGLVDADVSLPFESLVERSGRAVEELLKRLAIEDYDPDALRRLIQPPAFGRWRDYADDAWFRQLESGCEDVLADFFRQPESRRPAPGPAAASRPDARDDSARR
jgi:hypothetical protein